MAEEFDPKKHGVGTVSSTVPEHLAEFWHRHFLPLLKRVEALENQKPAELPPSPPAPEPDPSAPVQ